MYIYISKSKGRLYAATMEDLPLLIEWTRQFQRDIHVGVDVDKIPIEKTRQEAIRKIESQTIFLWKTNTTTTTTNTTTHANANSDDNGNSNNGNSNSNSNSNNNSNDNGKNGGDGKGDGEGGGELLATCMVGHSPTPPNGGRINSVYTPSYARRTGYATKAVYTLSRELLRKPYSNSYSSSSIDIDWSEFHLAEEGKKLNFLSLFTDLANPTSNSIYQKIGFQAQMDQRLLALQQE